MSDLKAVSKITLAGGAILISPMHGINDFSHAVSRQIPSRADAFSGNFGAYARQNKSLATYVTCAIRIFHEHNLDLPDVDRITLIIHSALAAQNLFFAASLHDPEPVELYQVFETFILNCVMTPDKRGYL
jgi:hypothetical protein